MQTKRNQLNNKKGDWQMNHLSKPMLALKYK